MGKIKMKLQLRNSFYNLFRMAFYFAETGFFGGEVYRPAD